MRCLPQTVRFIAVIPLLLAGSLASAADALQTVRTFFSDLHSLEADFHQEVIDSDGLQQQVSDGHMWILRPGRFRWDYESPYKQQIVADGQRLWSYDEDLAQVTVQPMDKVLSSTPAMLLSGSDPIDQVFRLEALPAAEGELHVRLKPRNDDSNITEIHLYFKNTVFSRLEARDRFGNTTLFAFTDLVRNAKLSEAVFRFEPPAGTDVIGKTE